MKLRRFSSRTAANTKFHMGLSSPTFQCMCSVNLRSGEEAEGTARLLDRRWMLHSPDSKIHQIKLSALQGQRKDGPFRGFSFSNNANPMLGGSMMDKKQCQEPFFYVVRDDLLHPLVNGNKARKLDALIPLLEDCSVTDVVTCGGCQSAHAAAVAVSCAERGLKSHLLLRGEQPKVPTGYCLISSLYGEATYIPRSVYANRENMLVNHANCTAGSAGHVFSCNDILKATTGTSGDISTILSAADRPRKVVIINEGAGDLVALFGVIRLVKYLCQDHLLGRKRHVRLVVDSGTGTTAIGLGVAILCLGLPWKVTAVMLADTIDAYKKKEKHLLSQFSERYSSICCVPGLDRLDHGIVHWEQRHNQRKFGDVLEGEIESCSTIARQTGILVDPVYTLAAWEISMQLSLEEETDVVMLHTGGTLGMFSLAQRYSTHFHERRSTQATT